MAGGSAPAPWATFLCLSKDNFAGSKIGRALARPEGGRAMDGAAQKSPKEMTPRSRRRLPALLAGIGARLTRRAHTTRLGLKHEARFFRFRRRCSAAARGASKTLPPCSVGAVAKSGFFLKPRMAHPSPVRLWASAPQGSRTGRCATGPRGRMPRWASAGTQSRGGKDKGAIRGVLSLVSFFARAKKETRPRCGEPPLAFESCA